MDDHYRKLENMYHGARLHQKFPGIHLHIEKRFARITLPIDESYHHAGGFMHGAIYFKLLDDVCYFAAMSEEEKHFYVTSSFSIRYLRPFKSGLIIAESAEITWLEDEFHVSGVLRNEEGKILAEGEGVFKKSRYELDPSIGYRLS
jgi:uncharacterized protein (TIGR00369 family)